MTQLAEAHILAQQQLRELTARGVAAIWRQLLGYDDKDVPGFQRRVLPLVAGAQRHSVALTDAFLARELGRRPLGINPSRVTGAAARNGAPPEEVYRRPFVTVWSALKDGADYADALERGLSRLRSTAATDVQLAMRGTLREVGQADPAVYGYERVPDGDACELCQIASTQRYHTDDLMPIHNHCGCGVDVITDPDVGRVINRERYQRLKDDGAIQRITDQRQRAAVEGEDEKPAIVVAIREHGELGPVLVDADQHFTGQDQLAA